MKLFRTREGLGETGMEDKAVRYIRMYISGLFMYFVLSYTLLIVILVM